MRRRAVLLLALCCFGQARANLLPDFYIFSERPAPVPLALGSVLFHFYQDDYAATLQEALYVERRFGTNIPGRDELLLAKGSAALGLGMFDQARTWLAGVDAARLPVNALPRLHLAMARVAFLDGDDVLSGQYLADLSPELDVRPDVNFLRTELARRAGDLRAMTTLLARLPAGSTLWFFGWHNYAVAARAQGALDEAAVAFDRVATARPHDRQARDLVVRAGLQAAVLRYQQADVPGAIARLDAVPVSGSYGRMALAQRATLALAANDYRTAARVFTHLAGDPQSQRWDTQRVDALIGVPFALEHLAGGGAALPRFAAASAVLGARLQALDDLAGGLDDPTWLAALADVDHDGADADGARLKTLDRTFRGVDWSAWLADRDTQRHLEAWRRLGEMNRRNAVLRASAAALGEVAVEQELRVNRANGRMQGSAVARLRGNGLALERLAERSRALRVRPPVSDAAADEQWLLALASPAEAKQLTRLQQLQVLARTATGPELQTRIARLQGVVSWNIADEAAARLWEQQKRRRALTLQLDGLNARAARIAGAESERTAQVGAAARVAAFAGDLGAVARTAQQLTDVRAGALRESLRARIRRDRDDTRRQLTYAQLAVARITDQLLTQRPRP